MCSSDRTLTSTLALTIDKPVPTLSAALAEKRTMPRTPLRAPPIHGFMDMLKEWNIEGLLTRRSSCILYPSSFGASRLTLSYISTLKLKRTRDRMPPNEHLPSIPRVRATVSCHVINEGAGTSHSDVRHPRSPPTAHVPRRSLCLFPVQVHQWQ
jgi:hypothetical protein